MCAFCFVCKTHGIKYDIVPVWGKRVHSFSNGFIVDSLQTLGRHLGDKELRDKRQRLVKGGIYAAYGK